MTDTRITELFARLKRQGRKGLIAYINAATNAVATTIQLPSQPGQLAMVPDGSTVWVLTGGDTVIPITTASNTPGTPIPAGTGVSGLLLTPDGQTLYVAAVTSTVPRAWNSRQRTVGCIWIPPGTR